MPLKVPQHLSVSFDSQTGALTFTPLTAGAAKVQTVLGNAAENLYVPDPEDPVAFSTLSNAEKLDVLAIHWENQVLSHSKRVIEGAQDVINQAALDTALGTGADLT